MDLLIVEDFGFLDLFLGNMVGIGFDGCGLDESDFFNFLVFFDFEGKREKM